MKSGALIINGTVFRYEIYFFGDGKMLTSAGGRIREFVLWRGKGEVGYYDRGWYLKCVDDATLMAMDEIVRLFDS